MGRYVLLNTKYQTEIFSAYPAGTLLSCSLFKTEEQINWVKFSNILSELIGTIAKSGNLSNNCRSKADLGMQVGYVAFKNLKRKVLKMPLHAILKLFCRNNCR